MPRPRHPGGLTRSPGRAVDPVAPASPSGGRRDRTPWRPWAPALGLWLAPVVAFAVSLSAALAAETASTAPPEVATALVTERIRDLRTSVTLTLDLGDEPVARGGAGGVVTAVDVAAGSEPAEGARLVAIDGSGVIAHRGPFPFHRPLAPGASGADVAELHAFLGRLGYPAPGGDRYTWATARSVRELQRSLGAAVDGVFSPALAAFVPPGARAIREVLVDLGDSVGPGAELVAFSRPVVGVGTRRPTIAVPSRPSRAGPSC